MHLFNTLETAVEKKRIPCTIGLILIGILSFGPLASALTKDSDAEKGIQQSLTQKSAQLVSLWATLKVVNGVINVLQSAQISAGIAIGVSINPLEMLSPVDHILDQLSTILLWAIGAVVMEKLLLAVSGLIMFKIAIPGCMALCSITIWIRRHKTIQIIPVFFLIALSLSAAIPLSFQVSAVIEQKLFTNRVNTLLADIKEKGKTAEDMEASVTSLTKIGKSIISFMGNAKNLGDALIEDMINVIIIFLVTNIVIPVATVLGLFGITKYCAALILRP